MCIDTSIKTTIKYYKPLRHLRKLRCDIPICECFQEEQAKHT